MLVRTPLPDFPKPDDQKPVIHTPLAVGIAVKTETAPIWKPTNELKKQFVFHGVLTIGN